MLIRLTTLHLSAIMAAPLAGKRSLGGSHEQAAWRRFARLRYTLPTARMLHEFRQTVGVDGLRAINQHLVGRLLRRQGVQPNAVALLDATDLPAACSGFKKNSTTYTATHAAVGGGNANSVDTLKPWCPLVPVVFHCGISPTG